MIASKDGNTNIASILLEHGARVDAQNKKNKRPALHFAAANDRQDIAEMLINYGASIDLPDEEGNTPLTCAALDGNYTVAKMLVEQGASVDLANDRGHHVDVAKLLIDAGALIDCTDGEGNTLVHVAAYLGDTILLELLRSIEQGWVDPLAFACAYDTWMKSNVFSKKVQSQWGCCHVVLE
ncbi:hypothetical protein PC111_g17143 [Phytophthora cactorum]|uniref:Ankyrin repeat-containing domain n=1 Tax=Phytophthora cactorum TaxID=29920 RepID=A0A8T1B6S0_9STRA|nr:hypothetical protein PC112_g18211 [Phytophthora cactorum]KAG2806958.1 hypothetical protein PC111_g17143 [Phytophthora cactorum]KAG2885274.1 hypothetical protein PC114_g19755 [Phytophthora cactorum]KAG2895962.1 hypothetical protein PC115_g17632 [Phytophthora cactorum]KAG3066064.1 hypothetical protein PC122_g17946 [Phytophthora cactorum]